MKRIFILIFFMMATLFSDSFVGMEGYLQESQVTPDYLDFYQTEVIEGGEVSTILYPTLGFPALITSENETMSVFFRCSAEPLGVTVILSKNINGKEVVFLTKEADKTSLLAGQSVCKLEVTIPAVLPATVFNLALRLVGGVTHSSRNAVGFVNDGSIKFFILADPQIEDLQAKNATDMNYNNKQYPGYSSSILDYSIQEGIIGVSIAQYNITPVDFIISLGDMVFGINYPKEYRDIVDFILNSEVPFFATPGNHDGYAQFNDSNNFSSDLKFDGLNYWRSFFGPVSSAFSVKGKTFIMLNTYSGTPERRASGPPIGIGDNAAVPVSNYGGFLRESEQNWVDAILKQKTVVGIFSHQLPLGLLGKDEPYTAMEKFPDNSIIGGLTHEEWNFESDAYDSDIGDSILNETMSFNTGTRLTFSLSLYEKPISYFAGHAHIDKNICFEKGDLLIPETEVKATRNICFFQTTTASTSGSYYWGIRPVTIDDDTVLANYLCDDNAQCRPNSDENPGFQSIPTGNLWTSYHWAEAKSIYRGGDGITSIVRAKVTNYLPQDTDIILRFVMPANPSGYAID
ncbi:metallophosphoesterase, partial [bacterium]|nr:metallophosphoesterase [bacterium]